MGVKVLCFMRKQLGLLAYIIIIDNIYVQTK
ncbi:hypothetical protein C3B55_00566 [Candidatus Pseudomonas adelgestsugas]|uniref:Uncharacterized protein n=1 Tax=Candidatus Pseudomonas adelgestsugas TaxID=1302376 RepID=A0ABX5R947_9PSED|nr:hypothetical protein C3B55_00566 [Candidatus Pseudomonas adelgestsugas]